VILTIIELTPQCNQKCAIDTYFDCRRRVFDTLYRFISAVADDAPVTPGETGFSACGSREEIKKLAASSIGDTLRADLQKNPTQPTPILFAPGGPNRQNSLFTCEPGPIHRKLPWP
jgi:hypothetical protein